MSSPFQQPDPPGKGDSSQRSFAQQRMRYDEDDDDFDIAQPHRSRGAHENPTSAGGIGFIFAAISVGLLIVVFVLWILFQQDEEQLQRNVDRKRWLLYWFLFLDALSFFAAIAATVMCSRGLSPTNPLYRGWSMAGLILGIIELVTTILFGIFMTCAVMIFEAFGRR